MEVHITRWILDLEIRQYRKDIRIMYNPSKMTLSGENKIKYIVN